MSDRSQSIPPHVVAEVAASAHEIRAMAERLLVLAPLLPQPPDELFEVGIPDPHALYARYPAFELRGAIEVAVADGLLVTAEQLERAAKSVRRTAAARTARPTHPDEPQGEGR